MFLTRISIYFLQLSEVVNGLSMIAGRQTMAADHKQDRLHDLFLTGVRNAHALEKQALSIMTPQVERIENYPEVADRLRAHIKETNGQITRLDEILDQFGTGPSALKELGL